MVSRTAATSPRTWQKINLENFPSDVRSSYKVLLPKFNALRVVLDEQKRNTRDILEQREQTGVGSRPKTAAGLQLLLKSITTEYDSLQLKHEEWVQSKRLHNTKQDIKQVGAIMADLERKLNNLLQGISEMRKMWGASCRNGSAHSPMRVKSSKLRNLDLQSSCTSRSGSSRASRTSSEELQLPKIQSGGCIIKSEENKVSDIDDLKGDKSQATNDVKSSLTENNLELGLLKRREKTYMQPTRQRSMRTRQKLIELQTKGMNPEQLRNYFRERSFLNSVARRGSLHANADKRLLEKIDPKIDTSNNESQEPIKPYRGHFYHTHQTAVPSWTREGIMGLRRETTLTYIRNHKPKPILDKKRDALSSGSLFRRLSPVMCKEKNQIVLDDKYEKNN